MRLIHNQPGHYRVTKEGAGFGPIELPPVRHISMAKYNHTKLIADLSLKLTEKYQAKFIPERELRFDIECEGVGYRGHHL